MFISLHAATAIARFIDVGCDDAVVVFARLFSWTPMLLAHGDAAAIAALRVRAETALARFVGSPFCRAVGMDVTRFAINKGDVGDAAMVALAKKSSAVSLVLRWAAMSGRTRLAMRLLSEAECDPKLLEKVMSYAAFYGKLSTLRALVARVGAYSHAAAWAAAARNDVEVFAFFLDTFDLSVKQMKRLLHGVWSGESYDVFKLLLDRWKPASEEDIKFILQESLKWRGNYVGFVVPFITPEMRASPSFRKHIGRIVWHAEMRWSRCQDIEMLLPLMDAKECPPCLREKTCRGLMTALLRDTSKDRFKSFLEWWNPSSEAEVIFVLWECVNKKRSNFVEVVVPRVSPRVRASPSFRHEVADMITFLLSRSSTLHDVRMLMPLTDAKLCTKSLATHMNEKGMAPVLHLFEESVDACTLLDLSHLIL